MLNYFDVIKAQSGVPVKDIWAQLWGNTMSTEYVITTYTGTLPAVLTGTKAGYLHRYKIFGNLTQNGTPTPENPIAPSECGELETAGVHIGQYKLPLTSAGQDVDIYLGESQTTRRIKKLVLTGEEGGVWSLNSVIHSGNGYYNLSIFTNYKSNSGAGYCSHYPLVTAITATMGVLFGTNINFITDFSEDIDTADKWKFYLRQQYAAGTPVTVWYVLAEPETGIVNEPLRKIGDYADTVSYEQAGVQIPTNKGNTVIDVETTLKPSEMTLNWHGWHVADVKEYSNGGWR